MENNHFVEGLCYIKTDLCPCFANDSPLIIGKAIELIRHNSNIWYSEPRDAKSSKNFPVVVNLTKDKDNENPKNNYYNNFQFITDLFDILLSGKSDFGDYDYDHMLSLKYTRSAVIQIQTNNRYTAKLINENKDIVILVNPPFQSCKSLIDKSKRLALHLNI